MANEILSRLCQLTVAVSVAAMLVLGLRRTLRHQFGAATAYRVWLLLPVAAAAALLPSFGPQVQVALAASPLAGLHQNLAAPVADATPAMAAALLAAWITGTFVYAAWQVMHYRAFVRRLGPIVEHDGVATASSAEEGPMLLGLVHPIIVLPADFHQRYSAGQRELVLAHERMHARRRDPLANALFALAQCLCWFNPLIHVAAHRFRLDQEFACDHAVMQRYQGSAHLYAEAMLKTQLSNQRTAFACQWQSHHPLKERILNLNRTRVGTARRVIGQFTIGLLLAAGGISAWAAQGATLDAPTYSVAMRVQVNGADAAPRIVTRAGEEASISVGPDDKRITLNLKLTPSGAEAVYLHSSLSLNGEVVSEPILLLKKDQPGSIAMAKDGADLRMEFTVSEVQPAG